MSRTSHHSDSSSDSASPVLSTSQRYPSSRTLENYSTSSTPQTRMMTTLWNRIRRNPLSGPAQGLVITPTSEGRFVYWSDKKPFAPWRTTTRASSPVSRRSVTRREHHPPPSKRKKKAATLSSRHRLPQARPATLLAANSCSGHPPHRRRRWPTLSRRTLPPSLPYVVALVA